MSVHYVLYENTTGKIVGDGDVSTSDQVLQQNTASLTAIAGAGSIALNYVLSGVITARPALSTVATVTNAGGWAANGSDVYSYGTGLPNPTTVSIKANGASGYNFTNIPPFTVADGVLNLTTTMPGDYVITLTAFPYQDQTLSVTAS